MARVTTEFTIRQVSLLNYFNSKILTSAELVVGAVTVEVVALAELAAVDLCRILSLLAFAGAADTVAIVAADIRTVVFSAVGIQVLCPHFVFAALAKTPDTSLITPDTENRRLKSSKSNIMSRVQFSKTKQYTKCLGSKYFK